MMTENFELKEEIVDYFKEKFSFEEIYNTDDKYEFILEEKIELEKLEEIVEEGKDKIHPYLQSEISYNECVFRYHVTFFFNDLEEDIGYYSERQYSKGY